MSLKDCLHCVLSKVSLDCGSGSYDLVLACGDFFESFSDAVFALKQNYCLRIADNRNFCLLLCAVMLVDECRCKFADLFAQIRIIQHPVSVSVGHRVVPAHNLDAVIAGFCAGIFNGVCV